MDLLSCDNPQDAIRSLSIIYGVDRSKIEQVYLGRWPDFMSDDQYFESVQSQYFPWLMASHVGGKLSCDLGKQLTIIGLDMTDQILGLAVVFYVRAMGR